MVNKKWKITHRIYDKVMYIVTTVLFGPNKEGVNIFKLEWDYLIVLDACRCDIFRQTYTAFFSSDVKFKCITSLASSTMEFIKNSFNNKDIVKKRMKNVVFVNSNPMIDYVLDVKLKDIFYKYIPVWKNYWDFKAGSVRPEDTYYVALKTYMKNPNKKMIIWFLQPHYPYLDKRFEHINVWGRKFMNKSLNRNNSENNLPILIKILKKLISRGYLSAGIPDELSEHMYKNPSEVLEAYTTNLFLVLRYVKKLAEILPGRIVVTSDHGEAFGEPLSKLLPIRVYGHPSRIRIPSLIKVPYLEVRNNHTQDKALRKAFQELILLSSSRLKNKNG